MVRSLVSEFPRVGGLLLSDRRPEIAPAFSQRIAMTCTVAALLAAAPAFAQVLTIDTNTGAPVTSNAPVDRQFQQVQPTHVALSSTPMGIRDRLEIVRLMQAEQGWAMRPLPGGHKGLMLEANGKLDPAGEAYLNMVTANGVSVKPGGRVVITNVRIDHNKLIFDFNNGPDAAHRFLSHISLGTDPYYNQPVVADNSNPGGARLTLVFKDRVPELTGDQVKALLAPLISFDVKTPIQAYTDTLPKPLKEAILNHQVLVGMNTDMLMFAKGQPEEKYHVMDGQMPVDIWLYGKPPQDVTFVHINGNRVIRVELARMGQPLQVFTKDVVSPMLNGSSLATLEQADNVHIIHEGDVQRNPETQAPAPPPSLRKAGETLPSDSNKNAQVERPVYFPKQQPDTQQADPYPNGGQQGSAQQTSGTAQGSTASKTSSAPAATAQGAKPAAQTQPATIGENPDDQPNQPN